MIAKAPLIMAASIFFLAAANPGFAEDCRDLLLPRPGQPSAGQRAVRPEDLVSLRDFGPLDAIYPNDTVFSVSPDKTRIAFQVRRADLATNSYCNGVMVLDLAKSATASLVDVGGEYDRMPISVEGFASLPSGVPQGRVPKWSPDGNWLAYLRRDHGITQLWKAKADGSESVALTQGGFDVEDFSWSEDGRSIAFSGRPGLIETQAEIDQQAGKGYLYDDRFIPVRGSKPWVRNPVESVHFSVELNTKVISEIKDMPRSFGEAATRGALVHVIVKLEGPRGEIATVETEEPDRPRPRTFLKVRLAQGRDFLCREVLCEGVRAAWLSEDGSSVFYLSQEQQRPKLGLYRWDFKAGPPRLLMSTQDAIGGCDLVHDDLICGRETSLLPRHVINIDLRSGKVTNLFDLNPELKDVKLGPVRRLRWTNSFGIETFGDLVLPANYRPGMRLPLIVVGYYSRGFLRGGTGDEYPIQLYAAHGFAVLSFNRPPGIGFVRGGKTYDEMSAIDRQGWADRWSVQASLEAGVDLLVAMGVADKAKVGLTGFSDGASTAQFAMINSDRFSAMVVSQCCDTGLVVNALTGPAIGSWLNSLGYPALNDDRPEFWKPTSIRQNIDTVRVPILMELSDDEYLGALEDFSALRQKGRPVEMYVFPDEHHVKWQPVHRLAVYNRSLDWFEFWLKGTESSDSNKVPQFQRWRGLRDQAEAVTSTSSGE